MIALIVVAVLAIVVAILLIRRRRQPQEDMSSLVHELQEQLRQATLDREVMRQELDNTQRQYAQALTEEKQRLQLEWAETKRADRQASNARSRSALVAKIAEHMAPFLPGFAFNPKDARHIGELIDFIVYDGLEDGEIREVVFLEVKTRRTGRVTNPREKLLKEAIDAGRVSYRVFVPEVIRK